MIKNLTKSTHQQYSNSAPAKSGVRFRTLNTKEANDTPHIDDCVFFCAQVLPFMADRFGPTSVGPFLWCGSTNPDLICHPNELRTSSVVVLTNTKEEFHYEAQLPLCGSRLRSSYPQTYRFKNPRYIKVLLSPSRNIHVDTQTHPYSLPCQRLIRAASKTYSRAYALLTRHRTISDSTTQSLERSIQGNAPDIHTLDDRVCATTQALNHLKNFIGGSSMSFLTPIIFGGKSVPVVSFGGAV